MGCLVNKINKKGEKMKIAMIILIIVIVALILDLIGQWKLNKEVAETLYKDYNKRDNL
jgi:hypothetical protein